MINNEYDEVAPDAATMIEALRAQGYTLATAIADLIDNSIAARAQSVWIGFDWSGSDSAITVVDDGLGMSEGELVAAMRLGSRNPSEEREEHDLGRFGLGMKTASFSQARRLTVLTKTIDSKFATRRWDLDYLSEPSVTGWRLLKDAHADSCARIEEFEDREPSQGTMLLLEKLDRVVSDELFVEPSMAESFWVKEIEKVRNHLAMVFHRYLAHQKSSKRIKLYINNVPVEAWDPFCELEPATQAFPEDEMVLHGEKIKVKGFVLPHRDRFGANQNGSGEALHRAAAGPAGWNAQQGFYVYRNERLIIPGDWLGLGPGNSGWKKEEHYKLARIRIDLPNSLDHDWQIDIKKSSASAPAACRQWLSGIAKSVREKAKNVYAHRGGVLARRTKSKDTKLDRPWITKVSSIGAFSYKIDRKHEIFSSLLATISDEHQESLEALLVLIEQTVPVQRIWIDSAENQDGSAQPFEGEDTQNIRETILVAFNALQLKGMSDDKAWEALSSFAPFKTTECLALISSIKEQDSLNG